MRGFTARIRLTLLGLGVMAHSLALAGPPGSARPADASGLPAAAEAPGIAQRVPWTTSRITGSPEPPLPYVTELAFKSLHFQSPVDITSAPGSDRLFVVEQSGKIFSFPNRPAVEHADLVVDLAKAVPGVKQVYALAFHPRFEQNGYCYVCCIHEPDKEDGTRICRFRMTATDPPAIDAGSLQVVITWLSGGHNGCCLKFGPDGYLYISTGDGVGPNPPDTKRTGQDIGDLLSSILRIDVDHADAGRNYRVPADNPFLLTAGARPEIWAYGLRNPWRMSFDRQSGDLWVGDVGWELWELLYRVERGGNYGWAVMEGRQATNPEWPRGPTPILPPTVEHPHSESSSITDGGSYYGHRFPDLVGVHIYGDYDTGKIWGTRWADGRVTGQRELADTTLRIVGFGEDAAGEMYLLDHSGGQIHQLVTNPAKDQPSSFPRSLSETGLFSSVPELTPAPGVIPYSINAEPWEDHAIASRLVAIPGEASIQTNETNFRFPKDSVLAKTISLETRRGDSTTRRRLETQLLHYNGSEWRAYSYRWDDAQSDAVLVGAAGEDAQFEVIDPADPAAGPGGRHKQTWRFAGRAECMRCHNPWAGSALAFNTAQLHRHHDYGGRSAAQLATLEHIRLLAPPIPEGKRTSLVDPRQATADRSQRARAYLHANCAHCHRVHAGSATLAKMPFDVPLSETHLIGARPTQGTFGIHSAQVVAPGDPCGSVLFYRLAKLGSGRMPHLGPQLVDRQGVDLIYRWIQEMTREAAPETDGSEVAARLRNQERQLLERIRQPDEQASERRMSDVDQLLGSTSGALMLMRAVDERTLPPDMVPLVVERAVAHADVQVRDLFERFVPADRRVRRLGTSVRPEAILGMTGDASRGKQVFFETAGVQCKSCHRLADMGRAIGPDLSQIGKKYNRAQLLESILDPSKSIDPQFVTYLIETTEGRLHTGLLVSRSAAEVVLRDAQDQVLRVPAASVARLAAQSTSLMPELLVRDLTAQQVADLLEFLATMRGSVP